ncbi:MAG: folylpolyglutamate synthase/dihydrofolate synthase family protein [Flavihumibacter sp.]
MNYAATLDYLYNRLPLFSKQGASAYKKDLHNIIALEAINGNNFCRCKTIHVAGTNGKGSTSHMLAAILQQAGYKTGLYTSPHLHDFRERIRVNGATIPEQFVVDFTASMQPAIEQIEPSFFELTVSMAFAWFAEQRVDIAVIETGLGGRLDSTNIIKPEISVITNIGMDHMNILGDSLAAIAAEKAGIIKGGVPVVIGEWLPETRPVFEEKAAREAAPLHYAPATFSVIEWQQENDRLTVTVQQQHHEDAQTYTLDLPGIYQLKNLLTVLCTIHQLQQAGWQINEKAVHNGLAHTKKLTGLHGRWELVASSPKTVLDVGHNEDGIKAIVRQLELETFRRLHIVTGMVKDKDIEKALSLLPKKAAYYFTQAQIPRALPAIELQTRAAAAGLTGTAFGEVNLALSAARQAAAPDDLVLVCGSVFIIGEIRLPVG